MQFHFYHFVYLLLKNENEKFLNKLHKLLKFLQNNNKFNNKAKIKFIINFLTKHNIIYIDFLAYSLENYENNFLDKTISIILIEENLNIYNIDTRNSIRTKFEFLEIFLIFV